MPWKCSVCNAKVYNSVPCCPLCMERNSISSKRPIGDSEWFDELDLDILAVMIYRLKETEYKMAMTPQEEKFAKFFNHETILIKDMDDLTLRAHRDEIADIASEARARLTAIQQETGSRAAKKGVKVVLDPDGSLATEAINNIKKRQDKLTKQEKQIEKLVEMGIDRAEAENMFKAANVLAAKNKAPKTELPKVDLLSQIMGGPAKEIEESKEINNTKLEFSNPFSKKKEKEEIKIEQIEQTIEIKTTFKNPFAKKESNEETT